MKQFVIQRGDSTDEGCFGNLLDAATGAVLMNTLERTYATGVGTLLPKIPTGPYVLTLGPHVLKSGPLQCYAFPEFTGWDQQQHVNCLIHPANWESQLDGCVAVGDSEGVLQGVSALLQSSDAFHRFMDMCQGDPQIQVTVITGDYIPLEPV